MTGGADLDAQIRKLVESGIVASPYAALVGVQAQAIESDRVRLRLPFRPELVTVGDTVHGGAITSLIDVAATAACWASNALPAGPRGTTIGLSVSLLAAARGKDLEAEARVIQRGSSICTCSVSVTDAGGTHVAQATVSYKLSGRPEPGEVLDGLFRGRTPEEQEALLAQLERGGAALYRAWAERTDDAAWREALLSAARREEQNAESLEGRKRS